MNFITVDHKWFVGKQNKGQSLEYNYGIFSTVSFTLHVIIIIVLPVLIPESV